MNPNPPCKSGTLAGLVGALFFATADAPAAVLFSDNFNTDSSASWTANYAPAGNAAQQSATFAFDYSPFGIPPAPGSSDTLGLQLRSNIPGTADHPVTTRPTQVVSGLSVSPTGKDFGTSYHLAFYAWVNFNGAANAQGLADNAASEGGTHNVLFAVGTSGTAPLVVGNTALVTGASMDGIAFATTGDGGIALDYRVYPKSGTVLTGPSGAYAAGTANDATGQTPLANLNAYYQGIPVFAPHSAPAIQQSLSTAEYGSDAANTQAGLTQRGSFGFAWHRVDIVKIGNIVKWTIDHYPIATMDATSVLPLGGNNIALGDSDVNTTTTRHPSLLFSLFDNLTVTDIAVPSLAASLAGGNLNLSWPEATGAGFSLQSATNLTPPVAWSTVSIVPSAAAGTLSVSLAATNAQSFFRLKFP